MAQRLSESLRLHGRQLSDAESAIRGFDLQEQHVERCRRSTVSQLLGHHGHDSQAADRRPRTPRLSRQAPRDVPADRLALAGQLGRAVHRGLRTTNPSDDLTTQPRQAQPRTPVEKPDRPAASSRHQGERRIRIVLTHPRIPHRWIEAELPALRTGIRSGRGRQGRAGTGRCRSPRPDR